MKLVEKLFFLLFLTVTMAFAEPNVHQIFTTMESGHLDEAHTMIQEVLKTHPNSAKAHYVDAEILVRQGNKQAAHDELAIAKQLAPNLSFAKADAVAALEARIGGNSTVANQVMPLKKQESFPWMMLLLAVGALLFLVLMVRSLFSRRQNSYAPVYNNMGASSGQGYPNNSGYNNANQGYSQGGGLGSNIMSGLATGAAAGVGMVAAEEVMHHFMDHNDTPTTPTQSFDNYQPSTDIDDNDFGINDSSSWDDGGSSDDSSW